MAAARANRLALPVTKVSKVYSRFSRLWSVRSVDADGPREAAVGPSETATPGSASITRRSPTASA